MQSQKSGDDAENVHRNTKSRAQTKKKKPLGSEQNIIDSSDGAKCVAEKNTAITCHEGPVLKPPAVSPHRTWLKVSCESLLNLRNVTADLSEAVDPPANKETESAPSDHAFQPGTLVWAFMSGYPLWPAIVTVNAEEKTYVRQKRMKRGSVNMFHIQFFGDNGRHSWIAHCSLVAFVNGQRGLADMKAKLETKMEKNKKFLVAVQQSIGGGRGGAWEIALKEATACEKFRDPASRIEYFLSLTKPPLEKKRDPTPSAVKSSNIPRKRSREGETQPAAASGKATAPKEIPTKKAKKVEKKEIDCCKCFKPFQLDFDNNNVEGITCPECTAASCFSCKGGAHSLEALRECSVTGCTYSYHRKCTEHRSLAFREISNKKLLYCPVHYCHTCFVRWKEDGEKGELQQHKKLLRCVLCPTAFHNEESCLAAGTLQLSSTKIVCHRHGKSSKNAGPVHVNWCFLCSKGGTLMCCERCPASFHLECLGLTKEPEEAYLCDDCQLGSTLLLGDIVWVRLGHYRWWPARIVASSEVPANLASKTRAAGEFFVQFYGTHDYAVVHRGQAFRYQEGDTGGKETSKTALAARFQIALEEAAVAFEQRKKLLAERSATQSLNSKSKPPPYVQIKCNRYVGKVRAPTIAPTPCECKADMDHPCGASSNCINRLLLFECNSAVCPAGDRCENQRLQKRSYPPLQTFRTPSKGWGLKSTVDIKKGELVIEYVGEVIDELEFKNRLKARQEAREESFYFLTLDANRVIDAGPKGNLARFMNHSCSPNCETQKWTVQGDTRIGLFAVTDIPAGTELTFNYQLESATLEGENSRNQQPCHCGASNCSGFIGAKPKPKVEKSNRDVKPKPVKKKRLNPKQKNLKVYEDLCFRCGDGGDLILCDEKTCCKVYHLECLSLSTPPKGTWTCPWHHCDVCGKKSSLLCDVCPNSYCAKHIEPSQFREDPRFGQVCNDHSEEYLNSVLQDKDQ